MMGFSNSFVASIIVNNKPLREFNYSEKRTCKIPFGSEYAIRAKNLTSHKALVAIDIDGTDVMPGKKVVLNAYQTIDIERFLDDVNSGRKFKFASIEEGVKTGQIQDPSNKDNGTIKVTFFKEIPKERNIVLCGEGSKMSGSVRMFRNRMGGQSVGGQHTNSTKGATIEGASELNEMSWSTQGCERSRLISDSAPQACAASPFRGEMNFTSTPINDKGATVEGDMSSQQFHLSNEHFDVDWNNPIEIVFHIRGANPETNVSWGLFVGGQEIPKITAKDRSELVKALGSYMVSENDSITIRPV